MEELHEFWFLMSHDEDTNEILTTMVIKYWMEWIETICIFILEKKDCFCKDNLMDNENNFMNSSMTELTNNTREEEIC